MRLTVDLIQQSPTFINAVKDRELDLRGNKIATIENLGATKDLNDTLNFCDNDLRKLDNLPLLMRLRTLLISNNRVRTIEPNFAQKVPQLETLVLTKNLISHLVDLEPLRGLPYLQYLSLLDNPVTKEKHYRSWVIWRLPSVRVLDFQRIKQKERQDAAKLFSVGKGEMTSLAKSILDIDTNTFVPGEGVVGNEADSGDAMDAAPSSGSALAEQQAQLRDRIAQSTSFIAGVQRLENLMDAGHIAGGLAHRAPGQKSTVPNEVDESSMTVDQAQDKSDTEMQ
ncbi:U2 snRNP complex subunit [Dimargaris cristalligena]|nr:U2 snRNP complex subunit [Dimargaris cristalligena]